MRARRRRRVLALGHGLERAGAIGEGVSLAAAVGAEALAGAVFVEFFFFKFFFFPRDDGEFFFPSLSTFSTFFLEKKKQNFFFFPPSLPPAPLSLLPRLRDVRLAVLGATLLQRAERPGGALRVVAARGAAVGGREDRRLGRRRVDVEDQEVAVDVDLLRLAVVGRALDGRLEVRGRAGRGLRVGRARPGPLGLAPPRLEVGRAGARRARDPADAGAHRVGGRVERVGRGLELAGALGDRGDGGDAGVGAAVVAVAVGPGGVAGCLRGLAAVLVVEKEKKRGGGERSRV